MITVSLGMLSGILATVLALSLRSSLKNWRAAARRLDREARDYGH